MLVMATDPAHDSLDPAVSNSAHYRVVYENERVRVLDYTDEPGDKTTPHEHPDSVMYTLSSFRRRLIHGDEERDVELTAGGAFWVPAQQHAGENIGDSDTHTVFVELKEPAPDVSPASQIGPQ